jgi:hypothetical protein
MQDFCEASILHIPRLALCAFRFIVSLMFELTRREQTLVVGFVFILVLGLGVRHWRETRPDNAAPAAVAPKTQ